MSMIDEGKIKDKIIDRLMEEARKLVGLEVDHLRRLGYVFVADALEEWLPLIEDWDVEIEAGIVDETPGKPLAPLSKEAKEERKPLPPHVLANGSSEKIHEDKGNLRESKPLKREQDSRKDEKPRDANGEVLEVGDLVKSLESGKIYHLDRPSIHKGFFCGPPLEQDGEFELFKKTLPAIDPSKIKVLLAGPNCTKLYTLTEEQYLPLCRRTWNIKSTEAERISEHALGLIEELEEFKSNPCIEEAGDVLWYATMLIDVIGERKELALIPKNDSIRWFGIIKKAAHQQRAECLDALHEAATRSVKDISSWAFSKNLSLGEIRLANIKKLIARYPEGFVNGGGER